MCGRDTEAQHAEPGPLLAASAIAWVVHAVQHFYLLKVEGAHALKTGHVHADLIWVRATPMMGIDPADATEVVHGHTGVESVDGQRLLALGNPQIVKGSRRYYGPTHAA